MKMKKVLAMLLALVMLVGLMPITALAADDIRLVMCWVDWVDGAPVRSQEYITEWYPWPNEVADLYPALLINGHLSLLDPADLYSGDNNELAVSPSAEVSGAVQLELHTMDAAPIYYTHSDGETYAFWAYPELPLIGFYSEPEATAENYLVEFTADEDNDVVYLISRDDYTIDELYLDGFPAGTTWELSADEKMVTVTIGHSVAQNSIAFASFTAVEPNGTRWESWGDDFILNTTFPGIYFRYPNWDSGEPQPDLTFEPQLYWSRSKGDTESCFFYYFDGSSETLLTASDLYSSDESLVFVSEDEQWADTVYLEAKDFGSGEILYDHNDKTYSLPVISALPDVGFYTAPFISEENYISGYGLSIKESGSTIYLLLGERFPAATITSANLYADEYALFPAGSTYEISADGRSVAITLGEMTQREMWCGANFDVYFTDWGYSEEIYSGLHLTDEQSDLFFYDTIVTEEDIMIQDDYRHYDLTVTPSYNTPFAPRISVGDEVINVDPAKLRSSNEEIITVGVCDFASDLASLSFLHCGSAEILYTHTDGKTYTLHIEVTLPEFGFYTKPTATEEAYIVDVFEASEGNDTVYLVAQSGYSFTNLDWDNLPDDTECTVSEDGTVATFKLGLDPADNWVWVNFDCNHPDGNLYDNWGAGFHLKVASAPSDTPEVPSDMCGDALYWYIEDGVLYIYAKEGSSLMYNYEPGGAPWYDRREEIHTVLMQNGGTIGNNAFYGLSNLYRLELSKDLMYFEAPFAGCSYLTEVSFPDGNDNGMYIQDGCIMKDVPNAETGETETVLYAYAPNYSSNVNIPEGPVAMHFGAFHSSAKLESILIPRSITNILPDAFAGCDALSIVHYPGTPEEYAAIAVQEGNYALTAADVHYLIYHEETAESCTKAAVAAHYSCDICGLHYMPMSYVEKGLSELEYNSIHKWDNGTDAGNGLKRFTCSDCGAVKTETVSDGSEPALYMHSAQEENTFGIERNNFTSWQSPVGSSEFAVLFFDGSEEILLSYKQLTSDNAAVCVINRPMYNADMTKLVFSEEGTAAIRYTHTDGKTYSISIKVGELTDNSKPEITPEPTPVVTPEPTPVVTPEPTPVVTPEPEEPEEPEDPVVTPVPGISGNGWHFNEGVLTISGEGLAGGYMYDWQDENTDAPWFGGGNGVNGGYGSFYRQIKEIKVEEGITGLGPAIFAGLKYVETVTLPSTLETIDDYAFAHCAALKTIDLPEGLTMLGSNAFEDSGITEITVPGSVGKIEDHTFFNCSDLATVTLGEGITSIGRQAFASRYTTGLTTLNLPSTLTKINGSEAFWGAKNLLEVNFAGTREVWKAVEMDDYVRTQLEAVIHYGDIAPEVTPTPPPAAENPFTDVKDNDWFFNPVQWAVQNNVTGGLTATTFGPNASCTRAQVVTFLYAAAGKPEVNPTNNPFTDVKESDWFYKPVMWAVENGITGGLTATTFGPNETCTRAQVVTFLYAAAGKPAIGSTDHPFTDVKSGDWYLNPVLWAVEKGVTGGKTANTFAPNETCTRAQVVTFLYAYKTK